ncbi:RNA splicing factor PRP9 [Mycena sanguinolenta]|uniref:RNA splicing factor PRP9 n=1 Tax=Mycena sanguinolenta TaxID=230812 RepID=A0A8H7CZ13_9AGAR|nr:RNA splicing factor PRP9 [Mycena sanguinolenta]
MDSVIELQRQTHEEIERFERALYTLLSRNTPTHEQRLQTEHRAAQVLDRISSRVISLNSIYEDEERRRAEIDLLSTPANQNDLSEFYARLVKVQEHHAKYPDSVPGGFDLELAVLLEDYNQDGADDDYEEEDPISLLFSGEEAYGKYVDLYANHTAFCNLKNIGKRPGYLQYLDLLLLAQSGQVHRDLGKDTRFSKDFEVYIKNLHTYLLSFAKKAMPLVDIESQQQEAAAEFEKKWEAGEIKGWEENAPKAAANGNASEGIWCGACQKNYTKQTVYDAHLTSKKHQKAEARLAESGGSSAPNPNGSHSAPVAPTQSSAKFRLQVVARLTALTTSLLASLAPTLNETKSNVERRFSLTAREREQELLDAAKPPPPPAPAKDGAAEEEEEEERIYNPLKLPLGWDGKPIPYWLYKLHGLGVEYRCEICSDHVYMGRKNFDRHFQESRHAFGMRALGLPNTKHFHEITRIEDALSLAEKLKMEGRHEIFEQETMEELEDDEGNVYNRKTYEDLKKQGII